MAHAGHLEQIITKDFLGRGDPEGLPCRLQALEDVLPLKPRRRHSIMTATVSFLENCSLF